MKRLFSLILTVALLAALCACGSEPLTPQGQESAPYPGEAAPAESTPFQPAIELPSETFSAMASTLQRDEAGTLWTSIDGLEDARNLHEILPEDIGSVGNFCFGNGLVYFAAKEFTQSVDPAKLYAADPETGECTLLADNLSPACSFCVLGESAILYPGLTGLWATLLATGETAEILPDGMQLLTARDGNAYYTRSDGALYRSDSTFTSEEKLLDTAPSYWLAAGADILCNLAYTDALAVIEFRNMDGTLRSRQPLEEAPAGFYSDGEQLYVPQIGAQTLLVFDIASESLLQTISLPGAYMSCLVTYADSEVIYLEVMEAGSFSLIRMAADGSDPTKVADLPF